MSDYVPTTEEVRDGYVKQMTHWTSPRQADKWQAEFDRWLASIKAEAWQEGYGAGFEYGIDLESHNARGIGPFETIEPTNPYREQETT